MEKSRVGIVKFGKNDYTAKFAYLNASERKEVLEILEALPYQSEFLTALSNAIN